MTTSTIRPTYQMTRIAAGDYLLPSNDRKKLWRIKLYTEGPSSGLDWPADKEVWGLWEWTGQLDGGTINIDDWNRWNFHEGPYDTRKAAVQGALKPPSTRARPHGGKTLQEAIRSMAAGN